MSDSIEVEDHVRIGQGDVHWIVRDLFMSTGVEYASLESPMSNRHVTERVDRLVLHTKGSR